MFDQRMNLDPFESELDPFVQHLKRILWPVAGTQPHETVNASCMLFHGVGNVLIGFSIIRRLADTDGKRDDPVHSGIIHRRQHVLRHEFHDRGNLMNGEFFSRAHVRMRVDDLDLFSFNINHVFLLSIRMLNKMHFEKASPAKAPRAQRKIILYFSEPGVLCVFAGVPAFAIQEATRISDFLVISSPVPSRLVSSSSYRRIFPDWGAAPSCQSALRRYPPPSLILPYQSPAPEATPDT